MGDRLKGKVAIVTGAGRGIGRGEVLALAAEGASVVVNDLGAESDGSGFSAAVADGVVAEITKMGGIAVSNYDSVATMRGGENIVKTAIDNFGKLDILVNNAGIVVGRSAVFDMPKHSWDTAMAIHLKGCLACTKYACQVFRRQRSGRIINTSAVSGLGSASQLSQSAASKEGIVGFTRAVAREMGPYGVTCNAIRPRAFTRLHSPEALEIMKRDGRFAELQQLEHERPEDMAPFVVFLATDEAANINGKVFLVRRSHIGIYPEPEPEKTIYKDGPWTLDELLEIVPRTLAAGLVNKWAQIPEEEK